MFRDVGRDVITTYEHEGMEVCRYGGMKFDELISTEAEVKIVIENIFLSYR